MKIKYYLSKSIEVFNLVGIWAQILRVLSLLSIPGTKLAPRILFSLFIKILHYFTIIYIYLNFNKEASIVNRKKNIFFICIYLVVPWHSLAQRYACIGSRSDLFFVILYVIYFFSGQVDTWGVWSKHPLSSKMQCTLYYT